MRLESLRSKTELKDVLLEPRSSGPEIAYWVYSGISKAEWTDMTIIAPGLYGKEFPKTYGHYHTARVLETYKLISGEGIFLMQRKHMENGRWIYDKVDEVFMIKLAQNEQITIPYDFGHSWSNVGETPLITFDNWRSGHVDADYEFVKKLKGMCFYITNDNGIKFIENPNYKNHPEPKIVTAKQFQALYPVD